MKSVYSKFLSSIHLPKKNDIQCKNYALLKKYIDFTCWKQLMSNTNLIYTKCIYCKQKLIDTQMIF